MFIGHNWNITTITITTIRYPRPKRKNCFNCVLFENSLSLFTLFYCYTFFLLCRFWPTFTKLRERQCIKKAHGQKLGQLQPQINLLHHHNSVMVILISRKCKLNMFKALKYSQLHTCSKCSVISSCFLIFYFNSPIPAVTIVYVNKIQVIPNWCKWKDI